jgi:hypothetical protein
VIVLSGVLTVVALVLLVVAGLREDYTYVYAAIAAGLAAVGLVAGVVYRDRDQLAVDDEDEPRSEDEGVLVGVRSASGERADEAGQSAPVLQVPTERPADLPPADPMPESSSQDRDVADWAVPASAAVAPSADVTPRDPGAVADYGPHDEDPVDEDPQGHASQVAAQEVADAADRDEEDEYEDDADEEDAYDEAYEEAVAYEAAGEHEDRPGSGAASLARGRLGRGRRGRAGRAGRGG